MTVVAINAFTGLIYPLLVIPAGAGSTGALRSVAAYWITMLAAGVFVFCSTLAIQGTAARIFSYRVFVRFSSVLQLTAFFAILAIYFLEPPLASPEGLTAPHNQQLLRWIPAYWFLGMFQELNGSTHPVFAALAARAGWALLVVFSAAVVTYGLAYSRNMRRIVEQPDITPASRPRSNMRVVPLVVRLICKRPLDRAIILFAARGLARNRQHRLLVAAYGGIALAISLAYAKSLLYGNSRQRWDEPNVALLVAGFVLTIFGVIGVRAVFALPIALAGNWIFRTTTLTAPAAYFNAVRKSVYALTAVPIGIGLAIFYLAVWPWRPALYHMTVLLLVTTIVIERSMYGFSKIPFACSYSPGKANLNVRLGAYAVLFLSASDLGVRMELLAIQQPHRLIILLAVLLGAALWSRHRATKLATAPDSHILFEDVPLPILTLDTRRDGAWMGDEAYAGSIDPKIAGAS